MDANSIHLHFTISLVLMISLNSTYFIFNNIKTFFIRNYRFCTDMLVCTAAKVHDYNGHVCIYNLWLLIQITPWKKVPLVMFRCKAHRHKLLFDYPQVVWLQLSPQQWVVKVVVLTLSLLLMDENIYFMKKSVNITDIFKTRSKTRSTKSSTWDQSQVLLSVDRVSRSSFSRVVQPLNRVF